MRRRKVSTISDPEKLREFLKSHSLKATPQRMAVHEAILALGHASAEEISDYISSRKENAITVASVYNILNQFTELGLCAARLSQGSKRIFDMNTSPHVHLYDTVSHGMIDVPDNGLLESVGALVKKRHYPGYKLDNIEIVLVCHQRKKKKASSL